MTVIRRGTKLRDYLKARIGDYSIQGYPTNHHCLGVYSRAAMDRAAGYYSANDAIRAVIAAGKRHRGHAPIGAAHLWLDSSFGHIGATYNAADTHIICNSYQNGGRIDIVARSVYANLYDAGWCYPEDIPGWGPVAAGANGPTNPATPVSKPVVHVSRVQYHDRGAEVLIVQKALHAEPKIKLDYSSGPGVFGDLTLAAYKKWQIMLGYSTTNGDADGEPGITSLTELGKRHGFRASP